MDQTIDTQGEVERRKQRGREQANRQFAELYKGAQKNCPSAAGAIEALARRDEVEPQTKSTVMTKPRPNPAPAPEPAPQPKPESDPSKTQQIVEMRAMARTLVKQGYERADVGSRLDSMYPEISAIEKIQARVAAFSEQNGEVVEDEPEVRPEPVVVVPVAKEQPTPTIVSEPTARVRKRSDYRFLPNPTNISLPCGVRDTKTLLPASIAQIPFIFGGGDRSYQLTWGTVRVDGELTRWDMRVYTALWQQYQVEPSTIAVGDGSSRFAIQTSYRALYGHMNAGTYGGSGCRRIQESLARLQRTTITLHENGTTTQTSFHLLDQIDSLAERSGKRLMIQFSKEVSDRAWYRNQTNGMKPLELEAWKQLRGTSSVMYLMVDHICYLHNAGSYGLDALIDRLNLRGSRARQIARIQKCCDDINGLVCSRAKGTEDASMTRVLHVGFDGNKMTFSAASPPK